MKAHRMENPPPSIAKADFIEGMASGMAVLESFDTERQRLNATLAAQRAGLTRAAARRHLLTLAHLGYLETDGRYFWLAPKVLRFSGSYLASARLPRAVQPALNRLAAYTGDSFGGCAGRRRGDRRAQRGDGQRCLTPGLAVIVFGPSAATSSGRALDGPWPASGGASARTRHLHGAGVVGQPGIRRSRRMAQGAPAPPTDALYRHRSQRHPANLVRGAPARLVPGKRGARIGGTCGGGSSQKHGRPSGRAQRRGLHRQVAKLAWYKRDYCLCFKAQRWNCARPCEPYRSQSRITCSPSWRRDTLRGNRHEASASIFRLYCHCGRHGALMASMGH